jgi:hypothetical protein
MKWWSMRCLLDGRDGLDREHVGALDILPIYSL